MGTFYESSDCDGDNISLRLTLSQPMERTQRSSVGTQYSERDSEPVMIVLGIIILVKRINIRIRIGRC